MNQFVITIKSINKLATAEVTAIYSRLSHKNSKSTSSIKPELERRYLTLTTGRHPDMSVALIRYNEELVGWVGTRPWPEKFKGDRIVAQTVECFVAPEHRRRGIARLGLQALVSAGYIDKNAPVSVYAPEVVSLATQCGCRVVLFCEAVE
jgi:L-amino acid N-acyltransferase YncA